MYVYLFDTYISMPLLPPMWLIMKFYNDEKNVDSNISYNSIKILF